MNIELLKKTLDGSTPPRGSDAPAAMKPIYNNPIVEKIRDRAEALANRFGGDLRKLFDYYRQRQKDRGLVTVDRSGLTRRRARPAAAAHRGEAPKRP